MAAYDDIILGEGVAIDSGAAPVTMRVGSALIDILAYTLLLIGLFQAASPIAARVNDGLGMAITIAIVVVALVVTPALVEALTRGLSLGRLALGLRIVRDDGGPVTVRHAFVRALLAFFEVFASTGLIAVTVAMVNARGKRLGDIIAGTYAMRTRGARSAMPPVAMPSELVQWATAADVARLPDGLALTARLFLGRAGAMDPVSRGRIAGMLEAQLLQHVSPPPPAGTHPESFIAAVIATRRDREYAAALRAESVNASETSRLTHLPFDIEDVET